MKKVLCCLFIIIISIVSLSITNEVYSKEENEMTPVSIHGRLSVQGTDIVDENGNKFQLRGVSTHGIQWFPEYVNQEAFYYMRDNWKINAVRLAMYSNPNDGYNKDLHELVKKGVEYAKNAGIYVIIDWHILNDQNPNTYKSSAIEFFKEMSNLYKGYDNVIYEICNEPNGDVQWERDVKPYAEEVISEIRKIDNKAIIIVGTPTWSQDVDIVAQSPLTNVTNVMYALHFYSGTHKDWLRQKAQTALDNGLPIFVSEFGVSDASGNGNIDTNEGDIWINYLNDNNISWFCWNLSNKAESSSLLKNSTNKVTDWTYDELSDAGKWLLSALERSQKDEVIDNSQDDNNQDSDLDKEQDNNIKNEVDNSNNNVTNNEVNNTSNNNSNTSNTMNTTNTITNNTTKNTVGNNTQKKDNTVSPFPLPNTGETTMLFKVLIRVAIIILCIVYIKFR